MKFFQKIYIKKLSNSSTNYKFFDQFYKECVQDNVIQKKESDCSSKIFVNFVNWIEIESFGKNYEQKFFSSSKNKQWTFTTRSSLSFVVFPVSLKAS